MLTGHRFKSLHVVKVNGQLSGTIDFGPFIPGNAIAVGSLARVATGDDGGGADIGILEVSSAAGTQSFSLPVLPPAVARTKMSAITFGWAIDSGNATVVATLFFSDGPVSSTP
jgi:hypothetical protein